jgi:flagellar biosynthesis anti-sigma factor FlgM
MRIDSSQTPQPLREGGRTGNSSPGSAGTRASGGDALGQDSAQLSAPHVQVQTLVKQALQFPEIRQEKVSALRQAVLGGSYQPDARQVAEAVFAHIRVAPVS